MIISKNSQLKGFLGKYVTVKTIQFEPSWLAESWLNIPVKIIRSRLNPKKFVLYRGKRLYDINDRLNPNLPIEIEML